MGNPLLLHGRCAAWALLWLLHLGNASWGQQVSSLTIEETSSRTSREDNWLRTSTPRFTLMQRKLKLAPQAEPKPALSVMLIPNDFDLIDGNAAVQYLQALAFAEQYAAREAMHEFHRKSQQALQEAEQDISQAEPYVWLQTPPSELPLERVNEYLQYSSWQVRYLEQAAMRRTCDFDRNIRAVDDPVEYLLPEIQALRELARLQSMRFRLALAENRPLDAIAILGQQLALGHHMEEEDFLVSNLVGIACAGIGWQDAVYLTEHPQAPNLYWALAALPQPLVSMRRSLAYEREFLFEQFKEFREVDETPQPAAYWKQFVQGLPEELERVGFSHREVPKLTPATFAGLLGAAYPGAKLFLIEEMKMEPTEVDALPVTQAVLLAVRRLHEQLRDDVFKVQYLPQPLRNNQSPYLSLDNARRKYGWITSLSQLLLPAIQAATSASQRLQQQLALLQTIESIRDHLATHDGKLPQKLSDLRLPPPYDPFTLQPFEYSLESDGRARLAGAVAAHMKYEFILVP